MTESIQKIINENPDSLDIGTPSKGGNIKIYGDFNNMDAFQKKIENAIEVRKFAQAKLEINI